MGEKETKYVEQEDYNRLDARINNIDLRLTRAEVRMDHVEKKKDKIDSNTTWILRIIIGIIVTALIGTIIQGG